MPTQLIELDDRTHDRIARACAHIPVLLTGHVAADADDLGSIATLLEQIAENSVRYMQAAAATEEELRQLRSDVRAMRRVLLGEGQA